MEKLETLHKTVEFLEGWQEQAKKESLVDTFFRLVAQEKKASAKAVLEKIKQKSENSKWRKGYINALEGITVTEAKNDQNVLINQIKIERRDELRRAFLKHSSNELHSDFDRGFFSAWADYIRVLKRTSKSE
ncbi:MAG: hypothetical protein V1850_07875 [Candidatus Bathyarchaeota archaeon]